MQVKSTRTLFMVCLLVIGSTALARGPVRASAGNTSGWQLMSPQERIQHQTKIRSFKTLAACRAYQVEHHQLMQTRAQAQERPLQANRRDFCAHLPAANAVR